MRNPFRSFKPTLDELFALPVGARVEYREPDVRRVFRQVVSYELRDRTDRLVDVVDSIDLLPAGQYRVETVRCWAEESTGSLLNHAAVLEILADPGEVAVLDCVPVVGMGMTQPVGSDCYAYRVTHVYYPKGASPRCDFPTRFTAVDADADPASVGDTYRLCTKTSKKRRAGWYYRQGYSQSAYLGEAETRLDPSF